MISRPCVRIKETFRDLISGSNIYLEGSLIKNACVAFNSCVTTGSVSTVDKTKECVATGKTEQACSSTAMTHTFW